ncbi:tetratricopeptide repeat (TPR)-like superfamily protein [Actinidia rufa]|uniref:Tetratricopeptide repeat (TPR)-like superfamily protein n=1 Tax=Actinidia rufa TaxID=165716 RepID=A0A7J0FNC0_9ERIC|nr:tetratricopeptide repeat (TPR)-like superfamily protein [Actinidia rufa]
MTLYMPLFRSCTNLRAVSQIHAHLFVTGLHKDPLASTKLIESYAQMGTIKSAEIVFENFPKPDSFMYGVLIKCYVWNGLFGEAISLYNNMVYYQTHITNFIFPSILRACSGIGDLGMGKKIHGRVIKCGCESDSVVETSLLSMYGEAGSLDDAREVFDEMSVRDVVSWSSIISSYVQNGQLSEGLKIFGEMIVEAQEPDPVIMLGVAEACGELGLVRQAKSVHGYIVRKKIEISGSLGNSLIAMYGKCGDFCSAEVLFGNIIDRNTSSWTAMITCYNQNGCYQKALHTFVVMQESNVQANAVTMMGILFCCARAGWLREGKSVHGYVIRKAIDTGYELLGSTLIDLYANCGNVKYCQKIFDTTQEKDVVLWNMIISGYAREGLSNESLMLFVQMKNLGTLPDSYTLGSVLSACGDICFSQFGHQVHTHSIKIGVTNEFVQNSLIDMYSKCGLVDSAYTIFGEDQAKSIVTWNSMICAFSQNGNSLQAITLFDRMHSDCLEIDEVTFLIVIQACSNLGYLEKGRWVHHKVITYGVVKDMYIDTALTDIRAGDLDGACRIIETMPFPADTSIWGALLNGCRSYRRMDMIKGILQNLLVMETNDTGYYTLLSNIFAEGGDWDEFRMVRSMMRNIGLRKVHGNSTIEIDKRVHRFGANDKSHPQTNEIYSLLENLRSFA